MKLKTPFTNVFANAFSTVQAWRTVALVLAVAFLYSVAQLVSLAKHQNVLLVPPGLAASKKAVMVNLGDPFSPDYVSGVAEGDAHFLLDWTPENVEQQYGVFASRLSPDAYAAKQPALMAEAKQNKQDGVTQSFHRTRTSVKGGTVTLSGILVRNAGGKEVFRGPAAYFFEYTNSGSGVLEVASVSQPTDKGAAPAATPVH